MMNMYHPFDTRLEHRALGSAALTATATLDTITERAAQRTPYRTLVSLEAIKISANNELYTLAVQLSNDSFTTIETAAILSLGATEVRIGGAKDSAAGDVHEILWSTEQGGMRYAQARLRLIIAGTSPSVTLGCYSTILGRG